MKTVYSTPGSIAFGKYKPYFVDAAIGHGAKMNTELCERLVEKYSSPGDIILDPMNGIGTTTILGGVLGRMTVGLELNSDYFKLSSLSRLKCPPSIRRRIYHYNQDARVMKEALSDLGVPGVDAIITSPPYADALTGETNKFHRSMPHGYGPDKKNVGNYPIPKWYWTLSQIYPEAVRWLKPGGYMVVVVKKLFKCFWPVHLDHLIKDLYREMDLNVVEEWRFRIPMISMFRRIYAKKYKDIIPQEMLDMVSWYEYVVVGQKRIFING